jgi:hypothetical protein
VVGVEERFGDQRSHVRPPQPVHNPAAFPARLDQPGQPQLG